MLQELETEKHVRIKQYHIDNVRAEGVSVLIPGTDLQILQLVCAKGILFCGIFKAEVIEACGFAGVIFSAPQFEDMLERKPTYVSNKARELGVTENMTGREIVKLLS